MKSSAARVSSARQVREEQDVAGRRATRLCGILFGVALRLGGILFGAALFLKVAPGMTDDAAGGPPQPVPPLYVTENHGLMASFPAGLTYCPLPRDWVGSDHGTEVYLVPPAKCGASSGYASSSRDAASRVPTIGVFYEFNVIEIRHRSGQFSPPRTSRELMTMYCRGPHARAPAGITLLGVAAVGCLIEHGNSVEVEVGALYSDADVPADPADHALIVSLTTTRDRLRDDLRVFKTISSGIRVRVPGGDGGTSSRPACPTGVGWW